MLRRESVLPRRLSWDEWGFQPSRDLTLTGSWCKVTIISTGLTYTLRGADNINIDDFLELRAKNKNGTATARRIVRMQTLRFRIVNTVKAVPFNDMFDMDQQWNLSFRPQSRPSKTRSSFLQPSPGRKSA